MPDRHEEVRETLIPLPQIRFTPYAWAKLIWFRDYGPTEIGGFGIASRHDALLMEDFQLVKQTCTALSVVLDDHAVADYFDAQIDRGFLPRQFARVWVHTHPGDCAQPSPTDEATFHRAFGGSSWAAMVIVARSGRTYARIRYRRWHSGPLPLLVDFSLPFPASDAARWRQEYKSSVVIDSRARQWATVPSGPNHSTSS